MLCLSIAKPRFFTPAYFLLIRSLRDPLSLDFICPKKRTPTGSKYFLTIGDEFCTFPCAFVIKEPNTTSVISALSQLVSIVGALVAIHSNQESVFDRSEFKSFLDGWNACKTRTTPYNPVCNDQCDRQRE